MIIDVHFHPTNHIDPAWRHGGIPFNGERLIKMMDGPYWVNGKPRRIDWGVIQPPPGATVMQNGMRDGVKGSGDYMAYCTELVHRYPDRLIGNFNYNPRFRRGRGHCRIRISCQGTWIQDDETAFQYACVSS